MSFISTGFIGSVNKESTELFWSESTHNDINITATDNLFSFAFVMGYLSGKNLPWSGDTGESVLNKKRNYKKFKVNTVHCNTFNKYYSLKFCFDT